MSAILYADYKVIIQETKDKIKLATFTLHNLATKYHLEISITKTKTMAIGKYQVQTKIVMEHQTIEQMQHFRYLKCDIFNNKDYAVGNKLATC